MDSPFYKFRTLIRSLSLNDDSIVLDRNLKYLASDINEVIEGDENILWDALMYFNEQALEDGDFGTNFALLFTSRHFDALKEHLQSSDGNSIFRAHILNMLQRNYTNADNLKARNINHFYNSVTLLGEFYNRMHQKEHPILVMGSSLFEILTHQLRNEIEKCWNSSDHIFDVNFARLILTQVTLNGAMARPFHAAKIDELFFEIRRCLIEVPNLSSVTKAFLLMTLDLYYSEFTSIGPALGKLYGKILDDHDSHEKANKKQFEETVNENTSKDDGPANLRNLQKDFAALKTSVRPNGGNAHIDAPKLNREYMNKPLKASDRLKVFQKSSSEPKSDVVSSRMGYDDSTQTARSPQHFERSRTNEDRWSQENSQPRSLQCNNKNESSTNEIASASTKAPTPTSNRSPRSPLLTVSTNCQDTAPTECLASPTDSSDTSKPISPPKFETNFNWFEAVENFTNDMMSNNSYNNNANSAKFDNLSVASCNSNPSSPKERNSPQPQNTNRSRRNSLNRFRSEYYKQSNEDIYQNFEKRSNRGHNNQQQSQPNYPQHSWRNSGRHSPRNDSRNNFVKRDFDRNDPNNFRRNLSRGGSVDSKIKDFHHGRNRHDSFNRRNEGNDNFEHFQSYNRKSNNRNKDMFMNTRTLPPRLQQAQQQKMQQQQQRHQNHQNHQRHGPSDELTAVSPKQKQQNSDCDMPKRFNNPPSGNCQQQHFTSNTSTSISRRDSDLN